MAQAVQPAEVAAGSRAANQGIVDSMQGERSLLVGNPKQDCCQSAQQAGHGGNIRHQWCRQIAKDISNIEGKAMQAN